MSALIRILLGFKINRPRTHSTDDKQIAATALVYGLTLVTRNVRDFESLGVTLINPFE